MFVILNLIHYLLCRFKFGSLSSGDKGSCCLYAVNQQRLIKKWWAELFHLFVIAWNLKMKIVLMNNYWKHVLE